MSNPNLGDGLPKVPSGTVTFLFTDIEGSTRLLEALREQYAVVLADQRDLLRAAFAAHNGHEIDTQGDSFFVAFGRAQEAVACVAAAQRALAAHTWPLGKPVRVRMGLHTGEPQLARTGYVGMDVNRAARVAAAGHGGQVLLSQTTRDLVYQDLPQGMALRGLGEHKLKDIRFAQPIFQLDIEGLPTEFPALKTTASETPPTPGEAPFKGLAYFGEADTELFFGREALIGQLVMTVCSERFLAVVGASGSGKSSVVRAGLVPALRRDGRLRGETASSCPETDWQVHVATPTAHPLEALATTLTRGSESVSAAASLMDDMRRDARSLHLWVQRHLRLAEHGQAAAHSQRLLLVLDQFEELFTLCRDEDERRACLDNLLYAATAAGGGTTVLLTLRADFYEHLSPYPALRDAVAKHQVYLGAMQAEELRQAIEAPAAAGGWEFSPGLVDLLLHEVGAAEGRQPEPGALPLLSHALLETWQRRRGNLMNLKAYAESGGVRGAIARTAETVFQQLSPEQQTTARGIFLRLAELGEGTQDTRRRARYDELVPQAGYANPGHVEEVLARLADARLITTGEQGVEVAHEALIREWPTLREWLNAGREGLRLHRHLTEAAHEWARLGREPGELYRGARLAQAAEWAAGHAQDLSPVEAEFMRASEGLAARQEAEVEAQRQRELEAAQQLATAETRRAEEQARSANRLRLRNRLLTTAGAAALLLAVLALAFGLQSNANARQAAQQQATAEAERIRADSQAALALQAEATAESDRDRADQQADLARQAQATAQADRSRAEQAAAESFSRELAVHSGANLAVDPERSILLALAAIETAPLAEAFSALQSATQASRLVWRAESGTGPLLDVAYSPDGRTLITGGEDGFVRVWDAATGQLLEAWEGHTGPIGDLELTRDGGRLATGSDDGTVRVWDMSSGQALHTLNVGEAVQSVGFSPDGQALAVAAGPARAVSIYDPGTGELRGTLSHPDWVTAESDALFPVGVAYSPDGSRLAVALDTATGTGGQVELWDTATGERLLVLPERFSLFRNAMAFSPDGAHLATGWSGAGPAAVWDAATGERLVSLGDAANRIVYSADGLRLLTATGGARTNVWDAASGRESLALMGHAGLVLAVAESPECAGPPQQAFEWCGRWLASVGVDGTLRLWDVSPMGVGVPLVVPGGGFGGNYGFSADGQRLSTLLPTGPQGGDRMFQDWLFQQWRLPDEPGGLLSDYTSHTVSLEPGAVFVTGGPNTLPHRGYVQVYETGRLVALDQTGATVVDFCCIDLPVVMAELSGDLSVVVVLHTDGVLEVWDTASEQRLSRLQLPALAQADPGAMAINHDGTRLAVALPTGLSVLDTATGETVLAEAEVNQPFLGLITFSRHEDAVLAAECTGRLTVFEVATGRPRLSLSHSGGCFIGTDISPDGTQLAAATFSSPLKVWDTTTGTLLFELPRTLVISRPHYSPDGRLLYASVVDNRASPDIRAYFTRVEELVAFARARLTRGLTQAECQQYLRVEACP